MMRLVLLIFLALGISKAAKLYRHIDSESLQHNPNFRYGDIQVYRTPDKENEEKGVITETKQIDDTISSTSPHNNHQDVKLNSEVVKDVKQLSYSDNSDEQKEVIGDVNSINRTYHLKSSDDSKNNFNRKHLAPNPTSIAELAISNALIQSRKTRLIDNQYVIDEQSPVYENAYDSYHDFHVFSKSNRNFEQGREENEKESSHYFGTNVNIDEEVPSPKTSLEYFESREEDQGKNENYNADVLESVRDIIKSNEEPNLAFEPSFYYITSSAVNEETQTLQDTSKPKEGSIIRDEQLTDQFSGIQPKRSSAYREHDAKSMHLPPYSGDTNEYPIYEFGYSVSNLQTGDHKSHHEQRDGDVVKGFYMLAEPDGSIRKVEYSADDEHGFKAVVSKAVVNTSSQLTSSEDVDDSLKFPFKRNTSNHSIDRRRKKHQQRRSNQSTVVKTL